MGSYLSLIGVTADAQKSLLKLLEVGKSLFEAGKAASAVVGGVVHVAKLLGILKTEASAFDLLFKNIKVEFDKLGQKVDAAYKAELNVRLEDIASNAERIRLRLIDWNNL